MIYKNIDFQYKGTIDNKFIYYINFNKRNLYKSTYIDVDVKETGKNKDNYVPINLSESDYCDIYGYIESVNNENLKNMKFTLLQNPSIDDGFHTKKLCDFTTDEDGYFNESIVSKLSGTSFFIKVK